MSLWAGDLALGEAFWTWTVTVGLLVNISTTLLFLMLVMQDRPVAAAVAGYAVSVPYNVVATVGVWRSAAHYEGPPQHADLARLAAIVLMAVLSVT